MGAEAPTVSTAPPRPMRPIKELSRHPAPECCNTAIVLLSTKPVIVETVYRITSRLGP